MTRKDYELMARYIAESVDATTCDAAGANARTDLRRAAGYLAYVYAKDNPRFDRARFVKACGFELAEMEPIR